MAEEKKSELVKLNIEVSVNANNLIQEVLATWFAAYVAEHKEEAE